MKCIEILDQILEECLLPILIALEIVARILFETPTNCV